MIEIKVVLLYFLFIFVGTFIWIETKHPVKNYTDVSPEIKAEQLFIDEKIEYAESAIDTLNLEIKKLEDVSNKRK